MLYVQWETYLKYSQEVSSNFPVIIIKFILAELQGFVSSDVVDCRVILESTFAMS
jgi:hypothetical protein